MAVLRNASSNRAYWVGNFVEINQRAIAKWDRWPDYWVIPDGQPNQVGRDALLRVLTLGEIEVRRAESGLNVGSRSYAAGSYVIPMNQPAASSGANPSRGAGLPAGLLDPDDGSPRRPYDVSAHTLPMLMNVQAAAVSGVGTLTLSKPIKPVALEYQAPSWLVGAAAPRIGLYKGSRESIAAGWTRWLFDQHGIGYVPLTDADLGNGDLARRFDVVIFGSD